MIARNRIKSTALLLTALGCPGFAAADLSQTVAFDIGPQALQEALIKYSLQAGVQVTIPMDIATRKESVGVSGTLPARNALASLLHGTNLTYEVINETTVLIRPVAGSPSRASGARQSSSALAPDSRHLLFAQAGGGAQDESQESAAADGKSSGFQEVVVTGRRFLNEDTSGATNLPIPIEKVPQSISLISSDFLAATNVKTLGEVAQYTPGALFSGDLENRRTDIKLRGFGAGRALDGLPMPSGGYEPDYAAIDRMEMVKGPSSVVYGNASPGGLVNLITKKATANTPDYLSFQTGMWNEYRLEGQMAGTLSSSGRVNALGVAAYEQADSFHKIVNHDKTVLFGRIDAALSESVRGHLSGGYETVTRTTFDGTPSFPDGRLAPVSRTFVIASKADRFQLQSDVSHMAAGLNWDVSDLWQINLDGNYRMEKMHGGSPFAWGLQPDGSLSELTVFDRRHEDFETLVLGASSLYKLDRLGLEDSFVSLSAIRQTVRNHDLWRWGSPAGTANIFDGVQAVTQVIDSAPAFDTLPFTYGGRSNSRLFSVSGQAFLNVSEPLSFLLGASYSKYDESLLTDGTRDKFDFKGQVSLRAAVMYELASGLNSYLSYSESFQPQGYRDSSNGILPPLIGEMYEVGLKYIPPGSRLFLSGAVFQITQSNQPEFDQVVGGLDTYKAVGEVRHRGVELEAVGELAQRWQLRAGYAHLDPVITKTDDVAAAAAIGKTTAYLPRNTASVFVLYSLTERLSLGAGARHVDSVKTSTLGDTRDLPGYTILDASLQYALPGWDIQLNAHNILDESYYINTYETLFYGSAVGAPASVSLSVRHTFN